MTRRAQTAITVDTGAVARPQTAWPEGLNGYILNCHDVTRIIN